MKTTYVRLGESDIDIDMDSAPNLVIEGVEMFLEKNGKRKKVESDDFKIYIKSYKIGTVYILANFKKGTLVYFGEVEPSVDKMFFQANKANIMADNIDIYANSHIDGKEYYIP